MPALDDDLLNQAYRYATALCGERDLAMDLVHASYVKYLERPASTARDPQRYFLRAVRNTFLDRKRHEARWQYEEEEQADRVVGLDTCALEALVVNQDLLARLWAQLNAAEREVLYLWAVEEYTVDEIALLTETPRGTLLSRLHRLKKRVAGRTDVARPAGALQ